MSQSQTRPISPPSAAYRYITKAPSTLRLTVAEVLTYVPPNWIREGALNQAIIVELPCANILRSHVPRISVEQLRNLVPQFLSIPEEVASTTKVLLPITRLALAYHLSTEREEFTSEDPEQLSLPNHLLPKQSLENDEEKQAHTLMGWIKKKLRHRLRKKRQAKEGKQPKERNQPMAAEEELATAQNTNSENPFIFKEQTMSAFFASLPTFIPNSPVSQPPSGENPSITSVRQDFISPPSSPPQSVGDYPLTKASHQIMDTTVLGKRHLITPLSQPQDPLSNESQLQTLLLTDEPLSIHRVLDLCSQLPGIQGCMLARGWEVVASSQRPGSPDPRALGSQAPSLLEAIRAASTQMGLGIVKAVTLFSSDGPVSFLGDQDLCFLIVHGAQERGFIPGVREKLQMVLAELLKSRLLLPPQAATSKLESIREPQIPS